MQILTKEMEALMDFSHDIQDAMRDDGALYVHTINQILAESLQGCLVGSDPYVHKRNRVLYNALTAVHADSVLEEVAQAGFHIPKDLSSNSPG
jgi:hypothetical protein